MRYECFNEASVFLLNYNFIIGDRKNNKNFMSEKNIYPLNGVKTNAILGELIREYGWEILAEQIPLKCFKNYPSFESSLRFLMKTEWARQRVEAFYLYRFKQLPRPSDEEHQLPPRDRTFDIELVRQSPAKIELGDKEFFDDPLSGPVFPSKEAVRNTYDKSKAAKTPVSRRTKQVDDTKSNASASDPWSKWRES